MASELTVSRKIVLIDPPPEPTQPEVLQHEWEVAEQAIAATRPPAAKPTDARPAARPLRVRAGLD